MGMFVILSVSDQHGFADELLSGAERWIIVRGFSPLLQVFKLSLWFRVSTHCLGSFRRTKT